MSASDLPEARHESPTAMARCLVTYIADPVRVLRAVKGEFGAHVELSKWQIAALRRDHLLSENKPDVNPYRGGDAYNPQEASKAEAFNNNTFITILMREHPERFMEPAE
jgi:hypothetical protein